MVFLARCEILANERVAPEAWKMVFRFHGIAGRVEPGQFVHVRCGEYFDPLLRRPFTIYRVRDESHIEIVYKVVGRGTALLSKMRPGSFLDVLGPLGRGFTIPKSCKSAILIGEGIGVASLVYLGEKLSKLGIRTRAILGGEGEEEVIGKKELSSLGISTHIVCGEKQRYQEGIKELLKDFLKKEGADQVFGCGSNHLLAKTFKVAEAYGVPYQVSLYQNMACGLGACLCCARKFRLGSEIVHRLVCKDGPVFNAYEVIWEV